MFWSGKYYELFHTCQILMEQFGMNFILLNYIFNRSHTGRLTISFEGIFDLIWYQNISIVLLNEGDRSGSLKRSSSRRERPSFPRDRVCTGLARKINDLGPGRITARYE